jgi:hypothetical protein
MVVQLVELQPLSAYWQVLQSGMNVDEQPPVSPVHGSSSSFVGHMNWLFSHAVVEPLHVASHAHELLQSTCAQLCEPVHIRSHAPLPHVTFAHDWLALHVSVHASALLQSMF